MLYGVSTTMASHGGVDSKVSKNGKKSPAPSDDVLVWCWIGYNSGVSGQAVCSVAVFTCVMLTASSMMTFHAAISSTWPTGSRARRKAILIGWPLLALSAPRRLPSSKPRPLSNADQSQHSAAWGPRVIQVWIWSDRPVRCWLRRLASVTALLFLTSRWQKIQSCRYTHPHR